MQDHPFKPIHKYHSPAHLTQSVTFRLSRYSKELLLGYSRAKNCSMTQIIIKALAEYKPLKTYSAERTPLAEAEGQFKPPTARLSEEVDRAPLVSFYLQKPVVGF